MKHIYTTLLAILPLASFADDTVGSVNKDGYYVANLPYTESFDNFGGNYDGTSQLPNGWMAAGDHPFTTANSSQRTAHTGTYYLVTMESETPRFDKAYTPFFQVEAGQSYTIDYWLWMPGNSFMPSQNNLSLTVGAEQDAEFHTTTLHNVSSNTGPEWTEQRVTFTAEETGLVCFCFQLTTDTPLAGYVGIDDLSITADNQEVPPTADFAVTSLSSLMTGTYCCYPGQKVKFTNLSTNATNYHWEMPGCIPASSTAAEPEVYFPATDNYTITLVASNSTGESVNKQDIAMEYIDYDATLALQTFEADSKIINRGFVPTYDTNPEFDFYTGVNHYYRQIAQRIDMPSIQECTVTSINYQLTNYSLMPSTSQTTWFRQQNVPMSVAFYGETDGHPDTSKCFGRYDSTIGQMVGMNGIGLSTFKTLELPKSIKTQGTFYIAFEIGEEFIVDSPDPQIPRSNFAIAPCVHRSHETSMWVRPSLNELTELYRPSTKDEWMLASDFCNDMQGWGLYLYIWGQTTCPDLTDIAAAPQLIYAPASHYDLSGRQVAPTAKGIIINNGKKTIKP